MKTNKVSAAFLTKFSPFLSKFKQSTTINVAHEQIRKIFTQFQFSQIAIAFASKMDTCDQLSEKQKKQYVKIYITLIDVYGQDIILEHYDRIIDSIAKKTVGVSEVIGHLCRTLLKRIYPTQNIANYIKHLLFVFQRHIQLGKIIKQIVESFDSEIIAPFQSQILTLIGQKMSSNQKNQSKTQYLQAVLATVLALQSKFYEQTSILNIIIKNFKNQDWNIRKLCVDISYALFVINNQANKLLHQNVMELKYDKIKHVRDSVGNYTNLYKQVYGDQKQRQSFVDKSSTFRNIPNQQIKRLAVSKSPVVPVKFKQNESEPKIPKSLDKSLKNIQRNQEFFQNAGVNDVIKLPQNKSFISISKNPHQMFNMSDHKQKRKEQSLMYSENQIHSKDNQIYQKQKHEVNFEQYLKNRPKQDNFINLSVSQKEQQMKQSHGKKPVTNTGKNKMPVSPKNNKNNKIQFGRMADSNLIQQKERKIEQSRTNQSNLFKKQLKLVQLKLEKFTLQVFNKLNSLQKRVENLERQKNNQNSIIDESSLASLQKDIKQMKNQMSPRRYQYLQESFDKKFNQNHHLNITQQHANKFSKKQPNQKQPITSSITNFNTFSNHAQSNLNEKIRESLKNNNWDQAFSLAIANGSKRSLLELLKSNQIPRDKLVQDCVFMEIRKNLSSLTVLKWLAGYIEKVYINSQKLKKLYYQVQSSQYIIQQASQINKYENEGKNYTMLKSIILRQIKNKLGNSFQQNNGFNQSVNSQYQQPIYKF